MEIEDGVPTRESALKDNALLIGMIIYCIFALALPIIGIVRAAKLIIYGTEVMTSAINAIGIGLIGTAVNFPVGFTFLSYPIANYMVFGTTKIIKDATEAQKRKFNNLLNIFLIVLVCVMIAAILLALYALINVEAIPVTAAIIFIILQAIGLLLFISGAISLFFWG